MKIISFLMSFCFLFITIACSMEDKNLSDIEQEIGNNKENENASIMVSLKETDATKAGDLMPEEYLQNAVVFLLDKNKNVENVVCITDSEKLKSISFFTKNEEGKSIYVVANVSFDTQTALKNLTSLDGIKKMSLNETDLKCLPKVSSRPEMVNFVENINTGDITAIVQVSLIQRTSRIILKELKYEYETGTLPSEDLKLTKILLKKRVKVGRIQGIPILDPLNSYENVGYEFNSKIAYFSALTDGTFGLADDIYFDTYANAKEAGGEPMPTELYLTFLIDNQLTVTKFCKIKTNNEGQLLAGYIYELYLKAKVSSGKIEVEVEARVMDWDYREISLGDIEAE